MRIHLIMSLTLTFTDTTSSLRTCFFPEIDLTGQWEIALLNLTSFNSIANLRGGKVWINDETYKIPDGAYELDELANWINQKHELDVIELHANKHTLRTEIKCQGVVKVNSEVAELLGYGSTEQVFSENRAYTSPKMANISKVSIIRINCNIAQGSYLNGSSTHNIHEFIPSVPPGYRIMEVPHNLIYHPINTSHLQTVQLDVCDQNDNLVDFRGEIITIRVHLRRST